MADRILGPAYPALLAPGLRVYVDGDNNAGTVLRVEDDGDVRMAWDDWLDRPGYAPGFGRECGAELLVDYADPHTRDRVARALEQFSPFPDEVVAAHPSMSLVWEMGEALTVWASTQHESHAHALRAVADAVWGPR